ncbi:DNA/RNA nuclease SfsA [Clostridium butyricum]|uniref:DNA/RNA nuclease SfsA n=1 Tax=Clostridium butyricum TaxID=1492 RepID=UPI0002CC1844|nr:DNA/RNA nuclease SfsA [Clostridium butyricum]EMU53676.1 sugar fermentation stimulation protein [Clostridium butyricum DKU-01]
MKYDKITKGRFISRPNRFIANVEIDGINEVCHVKNTGRCKELLIPGSTTVYVQESDNPNRKTKYSLIGVLKDDKKINMDSQVTNKVVHEWILEGNIFENVKLIKPEKKYKNSRFDFYVETENEKAFIEVKGVTLEENGVVRFPDAPTERGVKHINELCECIDDGYKAYIIFVIQMKDVLYFTPNDDTHKAFGDALRIAHKKGVQVLAVNCYVSEDSIDICDYVEVRL